MYNKNGFLSYTNCCFWSSHLRLSIEKLMTEKRLLLGLHPNSCKKNFIRIFSGEDPSTFKLGNWRTIKKKYQNGCVSWGSRNLFIYRKELESYSSQTLTIFQIYHFRLIRKIFFLLWQIKLRRTPSLPRLF